jgi:hypothetical protein
MQQAFRAFDASCIACYRYAGTDPTVIEHLGQEHCDHAPDPGPAPNRAVSFAQRIRALFRSKL